MRNAVLACLLACAVAAPAAAQDNVALSSAVFVERIGHTGNGRVERRIEPATQLVRGDKVVLMVEWRAPSARSKSARGFAVTSPVPRTLAFHDVSLDEAEVSTDGGRSWGRLGTLRIRDADGIRLASPEDVTHLRWRVSPREAARGSGRITYSAVVR